MVTLPGSESGHQWKETLTELAELLFLRFPFRVAETVVMSVAASVVTSGGVPQRVLKVMSSP